MRHWLHRLGRSSALIGGGGLAFHAFHGPEHLLCLLVAGVMILVGFVGTLLPWRKKRQDYQDGDVPEYDHWNLD